MGNDNNSNKDNHSITQMLIFLCLIICLVSLWFSFNTYYMVKNFIEIENDRINRSEVTSIE